MLFYALGPSFLQYFSQLYTFILILLYSSLVIQVSLVEFDGDDDDDDDDDDDMYPKENTSLRPVTLSFFLANSSHWDFWDLFSYV